MNASAAMDGEDGLLLDRLDAVLFDLDGTLLDTARDLVHALHSVCADEGQPKPELALAARYVSTGAVGLVRLAFPDAHEDRVEQLRARLVDAYEENICEHTVPYPGIEMLLAELNERGLRWGIVTNKMRYLAEPILEAMRMRAECATLIGGDTAAHNKPHPAPIEMALQDLGVAPERAVYVGDAEKDIIAGRAAGTGTVAVTWGYIVPGHDPYGWAADYTVDRPQDILTLGART